MEKPNKCPDAIYNLMQMCWNFVPENRPTFEEIIGNINSLMMKVNGGYVRMDSNASEKNKPVLKYNFHKNNCNEVKTNNTTHHEYVNLKAMSETESTKSSHYVDMRRKLKPIEMHPLTALTEAVTVELEDEDEENISVI